MWTKIISNALRRSEETHVHEHTHNTQHTRSQQPAVLGQVRYGSLDFLHTSEDNASLPALPLNVGGPSGSEAEASAPTRAETPSMTAAASTKPKRSLFKRSSRLLGEQGGATAIARRVKSSLAITTNYNDSTMSLPSPGPASAEESGAQSQAFASVRSIFKDRNATSSQNFINANTNKSNDTLARGSLDAPRALSPIGSNIDLISEVPPIPATPNGPQRLLPSVRSILRNRSAPGSGQNVRFFSRDAYRVISPETSASNTDSSKFISANGAPGMEHGDMVGGDDMLSSFDASVPVSTSTPHPAKRHGGAIMPIPPTELTLDFPASAEHNVHPIPGHSEGQGQRVDAAGNDNYDRITKIADKSDHPFSNPRNPSVTDSEKRSSMHSEETPVPFDPRGVHGNGSAASLSQRFAETPFHPFDNLSEKHRPMSIDLPSLSLRPSTSLGLHKIFSKDDGSGGESNTDKVGRASIENLPASRMRTISDRVFAKVPLGKDGVPGGNDKGSAGKSAREPPDPFRADASNYYNRAAGFPNSPPKPAPHGKSDGAMTKHPSAKPTRSSSNTSAKSHASSSTSSKMTRSSNMSKCSEDDEVTMALRTQLAFHQELTSQYEVDLGARDQIVTLLNVKLRSHEEENERRARAMKAMRKKVQELERACRVLEEQVDQSRQYDFERVGSNSSESGEVSALRQEIEKLEKEKEELDRRAQEALEERERLRKEIGWRDMDAAEPTMRDDGDELRGIRRDMDLADVVSRHDGQFRLVKELGARKRENEMLKQEVEAQWGNTEKMNAQIQSLQRERDKLLAELTELRTRLNEMEIEWTESENRRMDAETALANSWQSRDRAETERDQMRQEVAQERAQREQAQRTLETQMKPITDELRAAAENEERLQRGIQERDTEIETMHNKLTDRERELETLHTELAKIRRDHKRIQAEATRAGAHIAARDAREQDVAQQLEATALAQTEAEKEAQRLQERMSSFQEETDRLRRQVNGLKQHNADQDVKILQLQRQHEQDIDDKLGLNMALEAKQQELDLIKRNMGVRGMAGATPAVSAVSSRATTRRESIDFRTPVVTHRSSALSEQGPSWLTETAMKLGQTPIPVRPALGRTSRANVLANAAAQSTVRRGQAFDSAFNPFQNMPQSYKSGAISRPFANTHLRTGTKRKPSEGTDDEMVQQRGRAMSSASATTDEMTDGESNMRYEKNMYPIVRTIPFMVGTSGLEADPTLQSDKENTPMPRRRNLMRELLPP